MSAEKPQNNKSIIWRDSELILSDGIKLVSRIWHPSEGGPWPALLMRQPYGRAIGSTITYAHPQWWASQGYLVVIQDVRGQGDSEGCFTGFNQEATDTTETHNWVRSLPECNGILGTYGFSYQGLTQLTANPDATPPDCLVPAMTGINEQLHWSQEGGAYWWHLGIGWGIQLAAQRARREGDNAKWQQLRGSLLDGSYLIKGEEILNQNDPEGMTLKWLNQSKKDTSHYKIHSPLNSWLKKPMLLLGGLWDPHLKGILELYKLSKEAGGKPKIIIGPASHLEWWEETTEMQLKFFNQHLKNKDDIKKSSNDSIRIWNISSKNWQAFESCSNSSNKNSISWSLVSHGNPCINNGEGLLCEKDSMGGIISIVHDPWRPVPSIGGHLSPNPGLANRSEIDKRNDVATFNSEEFNEELHIQGIPSLRINSHSDQKGYDICVALSITDKQNLNVIQISTGFCRVIGNEALTPSFKEIKLQPVCFNIQPGQILRVSISGAAWPAIGINPGDGSRNIGASNAFCNVITLILDLKGSRLLFEPLLFEV